MTGNGSLVQHRASTDTITPILLAFIPFRRRHSGAEDFSYCQLLCQSQTAQQAIFLFPPFGHS